MNYYNSRNNNKKLTVKTIYQAFYYLKLRKPIQNILCYINTLIIELYDKNQTYFGIKYPN